VSTVWATTTWPFDPEHAQSCKCYMRRLGRGKLYLHGHNGKWDCVVSFGPNHDLSHTAFVSGNSLEERKEYVDRVLVAKLKVWIR